MGAIKSLKALTHSLDRRVAGLLLRLHLKRGGASGYLAAFVLMGVALLVRLLIAPLEAGLQYLTFFPAVVLSAVVGGFGPGLFAVLIGMSMATFIFIPPYFVVSFHVFQDGSWSNVTFLADGIIVCSIVEAMYRYRNELSSATLALRHAGKIIQATSDGFWLCDTTGKLLEVNDSYCRMTGYTREELLAMRIPDLEANESLEDVAEHAQRIIQFGHDIFETRHRCKDGSILDVEISTTFTADHGGAFIVFVRDISRRKRIEAELRDSEERFRHLFEKAPVGIAMARQDQKIFMANAAYCRMFGYTQEELRNLTITDLTHPDYRDQTRNLATGVLNGEIPVYTLEKKYLRKDGRTFWGRIIATEIGGDTPQRRYIMGIVEDVTERVEQEAHRLIEANEQKDILVREVHHRIKNNLQGVIGLLRQYASKYPAITEVIDAAIGKVYSIAIIHGLQAKSVTEDVDLVGLIESIIDASVCQIIFTNELDSLVLLDKDKAVPIALALNELVTNACKYRSANGPVTIRLKAEEHHVFVTIMNHFDNNHVATTKGGQGLDLAKSLLPKEFAKVFISQIGNIFLAELKLAKPAVIFDRTNHGNQDHQ